jgi:YfiH family protein
VVLCDEAGTIVGVAHAGWKGLAAGVLETTVEAMHIEPHKLLAWLGPAISQRAFEVGAEVRDIFVAQDAQANEAFISGANGKWMADIYLLAHQRLHALGISRIYGGEHCTHSEASKFFSYRRDGVTGRMGTFIWLE